jgi:hypothetical protein
MKVLKQAESERTRAAKRAEQEAHDRTPKP